MLVCCSRNVSKVNWLSRQLPQRTTQTGHKTAIGHTGFTVGHTTFYPTEFLCAKFRGRVIVPPSECGGKLCFDRTFASNAGRHWRTTDQGSE